MVDALSVTLNKMYRDQINGVALILGEVLPNTVEYKEGLRFFDGSGVMYKADGRVAGTAPSPLDLASELPVEETGAFTGTCKMFSLGMLSTLPKLYTPVDSDTFTWDGDSGTYINRMGFVTTYAPSAFDSSGRLYTGRDSMEDILYQIINR